ncbi:methyl-accepting chemotaxis protein [Thioclava sp. F28-4]|uniref:methyl-accepting chemotaxis protein n=1 Tax=Thioclava sp. F28-4 TaxID=1915315 RepID=UPI00099897E8|nr:methyl-accepting chemotaxis protein [Thioclava sp. F28-4]OOY06359.1 hypothetical protein BMI87_02325 [Thioclava sp. F28-4]
MSKSEAGASAWHTVMLKLLILIAIAGFVFATLMTLLTINSNHRRANEAARAHLDQILPMLGDSVTDALITGRIADATHELENVLAGSDGAGQSAIALNRRGTVMADAGAPDPALIALAQSALEANDRAISADGLSEAIPLRISPEDPPIAAIALRWSPAPAIARAQKDMVRNLAFTALIFAGILGGVMLGARWLITRPLTRVTEAMRSVAGGQLDTDIPATGRRDEIGAIARTLGTFQSELATAESHNRAARMHSAALESATVAIILTNNDHVITFANEAAAELLRPFAAEIRAHNPDFGPDKLLGTRADLILPAGTTTATALDDGARNTLTLEGRMRAGAILALVSPVIDEAGEKIGHVSQWRNITEEQRNASLISAIDANLLRVDLRPDVTIDTVNDAFAEVFGAPRAEMEGMSVAGQITFEGTPVCEILQRDPQPFAGMLMLRCADGRQAWLEGSVNPILDTDGTMVMFSVLASDRTRQHLEAETRRAERSAMMAAQQNIVETLKSALAGLSAGNLMAEITTEFEGDYKTLRSDFNSAIGDLRGAMRKVLDNAGSIRTEARQISSSSDDMARRTERQAATLEETAAALNEITASVEAAAHAAGRANDLVETARRSAEQSGHVVSEAVQAMSEIEQSSEQISRITSVIDEIAFQTNLLALNAGVEAARAGEAGRGFAVVASEVRALAQRSSDAAREIAELIANSSAQVKRGVGLVGQAGDALGGIQSSVSDLLAYVADSANATQEQSAGLTEINSAVTQLDQVTQHNAAMFEEALAASQVLEREAMELGAAMGQFKLGEAAPDEGADSTSPAEKVAAAETSPETSGPTASAPQQSARPKSPQQVSVSGNTALAVPPPPTDDDWEDF